MWWQRPRAAAGAPGWRLPRTGVSLDRMTSERPAAPSPAPIDDLAERAARIRAMLSRWANEAAPDEPEWSVEDIEPMRLERDPKRPGK